MGVPIKYHNGTDWVLIDAGAIVDSNGNRITADNITIHTSDNGIHITPEERTNWNGKINTTEKGVANGVTPLDINGIVPDEYIKKGMVNGVATLDNKTKIPNTQSTTPRKNYTTVNIGSTTINANSNFSINIVVPDNNIYEIFLGATSHILYDTINDKIVLVNGLSSLNDAFTQPEGKLYTASSMTTGNYLYTFFYSSSHREAWVYKIYKTSPTQLTIYGRYTEYDTGSVFTSNYALTGNVISYD